MPTLLLPLSCYDESGIIKPPRWFYTLLLLNSLDWLIVIFALASMGQTSDLLGIFYPSGTLLWLKLAATFPFLIVALLMGNRERLWRMSLTRWPKFIVPGCFAGVITVGAVLGQQLAHLHWRFEMVLALQISGLLMLIVMLLRSLHIKLMLKDWLKQ